MEFLKRSALTLAAIALALTASFAVVDDAEARRGGSFGSRGVRTFQAPAATPTAPMQAAPVQRSMTPQTMPRSNAGPAAAAARPGFFGGFGGSMLRGLMIGGLIGMLLGHGFGGLAGAFGMIVQVALLALVAMMVMRAFAGRRQTAMAGGPSLRDAMPGSATPGSMNGGLGSGTDQPARQAAPVIGDIKLVASDFDRFEAMLGEVQAAFGREDYASLRKLTTPEIMSYLSEELSQNATSGLRNDVSDVKLLQGDLAEAWREGDAEYATVAMRYQSRDVMRERSSGEVVSGSADGLTEATEIWTFVRQSGGEWQLSAIQET